jgi:hypothetical protein
VKNYLLILVAFALPHSLAAAESDLPSQAIGILSKNCYSCHAGTVAIAGLKLDNPADLADEIIVPGKPADSRLWLMINGKGRAMMPPAGKMSAADLNVIKAWIEAGAKWPQAKAGTPAAASKWWAFQKPKVHIPPVLNAPFVNNEVDRFVLAKLNEKGFQPAPAASRAAFIRRLSFNLHGLPPALTDVEAFVNDKSPDAYEKLVDRMLASKHYGEKWGKHWLDLVRYGDTGGFEQDPYMLYAWRYRDYVIDSFNADKPYDRFVKEQIAGDELFEDPAAQQGTGYYTVGPNRDMLYKVEDINRVETLTDYVDTTSSVFLGLTTGCARCHDHKYDPIPQKDYYRMQAIFAPFQKTRVFLHYNNARGYDLSENTRTFKLYDIGTELASIKKPYFEKMKAERLAKLGAEVEAAFATDEEQRSPQQKVLFERYNKSVSPRDDEIWPILNDRDKDRLDKAKSRLLSLYGSYGTGPFSPGLTDVGRESPKTFVPGKGTPFGEEVKPGFLTALGGGDIPEPPLDSLTTQRRKALAEWLASPENPLTARVMVNRVWQFHFGRGLVATSSDYGMRGAAPSHPELLDWLTQRFIADGWSLKKLHKLILLSSTYRQQAESNPASAAKVREQDPDNIFLSHFNRRRLEAEEVRDAVLSASGQLNAKMYGVPVVPELAPEELFGMSLGPGTFWPVTTNKAEHQRRSIYMLARRTYRMPMLEVFDQPEGVLSCSRRENSTTATQSLSLLNSRFIVDQASALATSANADINKIWRSVLRRNPDAAEVKMAEEFLAKQTQQLGSAQSAARELVRALLNTNEFQYVD